VSSSGPVDDCTERAWMVGSRFGASSLRNPLQLSLFHGAAQESNLPSLGLPDFTGFEGLTRELSALSYALLKYLRIAQIM
jgi:hypothetical protein